MSEQNQDLEGFGSSKDKRDLQKYLLEAFLMREMESNAFWKFEWVVTVFGKKAFIVTSIKTFLSNYMLADMDRNPASTVIKKIGNFCLQLSISC